MSILYKKSNRIIFNNWEQTKPNQSYSSKQKSNQQYTKYKRESYINIWNKTIREKLSKLINQNNIILFYINLNVL